MPVLPYYSQKEAPFEDVIWRFLDLRKFRDLMANQELYFRRADLFDDQSEGLPPEQYVRRVLGLDPYDINDQVALNNHLGSLLRAERCISLHVGICTGRRIWRFGSSTATTA
jgi:hypothetical protein